MKLRKFMTLLPCTCGLAATIRAQEGGGNGETTVYFVRCKCGVEETNLGWRDGRSRSAIRDWNQAIRSKQSKS